MDPHSIDSSLQKTLPDLDPTAVYRLTTEVSAQANVLAAHQQQLARLTSLTEELVKTLQALQLPSSESASPPLDPAPQAPPQSHFTASPRLAYLEKFDGTPAKCKVFFATMLLVCLTTTCVIPHRRKLNSFCMLSLYWQSIRLGHHHLEFQLTSLSLV